MSGSMRLHPARRSGEALLGATAILVYLVLLKLLLHLLTADNYGYFRDEFYYMAAGERLDLGYVDFPPFVALIPAFVRAIFGDSLLALHFFPALAGALVVVLAGLMARELGGGRFAQGLAALATLVAPSFLAMGTFLTMDAFDQLFWVSAAYVLLLILKRDEPRLWLLFGLVTGLGLFTKITILYFGFAVVVGLLLTPARRHLLAPWPWLGGVISLAFLLPYVVWQIHHGLPTLEFWGDYGEKVDPASPVEFLLEQIVTMQPPTLPLWLAGLYYYLLFSRNGRSFRPLGWIYVLLLAIFMVQNAKFYFLAPAYPMLFAAGALTIERFVRRRNWGWLKPTYATVLAVSGIVFARLVVPVLPVEERFRSCIFTGNYGEAGAIDFFGPAHNLPKAISGHNNYYVWGPRGRTGEVVISVGVPREDLETVFEEVEQRATIECEYCMPDEDNLPVYVSRNSKVPLHEVWPQVKHFD